MVCFFAAAFWYTPETVQKRLVGPEPSPRQDLSLFSLRGNGNQGFHSQKLTVFTVTPPRPWVFSRVLLFNLEFYAHILIVVKLLFVCLVGCSMFFSGGGVLPGKAYRNLAKPVNNLQTPTNKTKNKTNTKRKTPTVYRDP